jgi:hypothetical protein
MGEESPGHNLSSKIRGVGKAARDDAHARPGLFFMVRYFLTEHNTEKILGFSLKILEAFARRNDILAEERLQNLCPPILPAPEIVTDHTPGPAPGTDRSCRLPILSP